MSENIVVQKDQADSGLLDLELRIPNNVDLLRSNEKSRKNDEGLDDFKISTLDEEAENKLRSRMDNLEEEDDDQKSFFKREKSLKPPLNVEEINKAFPPPAQIEMPDNVKEQVKEATTGPLKILRYRPEGMHKLIPNASITFNQPMVELSSISTTYEKQNQWNKFMDIKPKVEGEFRWKGTQTLEFQPNHRFPGSTTYKVTVHKGINTSLKEMEGIPVNTTPLEENLEFEFETQCIRVTNSFPNNLRLPYITHKPIFYAQFDQKIVPSKVLKVINVSGGGKKPELKLLTSEEVLKRCENATKAEKPFISSWKRCVMNAISEQHLFFTTKTDLVGDSNHSFTVGPNIPSKEGPNHDAYSNSNSFRTYGPFRIIDHPSSMLPYKELNFKFSNHVELEKIDPYDKSFIKIEPEISNLNISSSGQSITIKGATQPRTTYKITFSSKITDLYDQNLQEKTIEVKIKPAEQACFAHKTNLYTIDPTQEGPITYKFVTVNVPSVTMHIFHVNPQDYDYSIYGPSSWERRRNETSAEQYVNTYDSMVETKQIKIEGMDDQVVETAIDLEPYLQYPKEKLGQLVIHIRPDKWHNSNSVPRLHAWIQVTRLSLDIVSSRQHKTTFFTTSLLDGKPVKSEIYLGRGSKIGYSGVSKEAIHNSSVVVARMEHDSVLIQPPPLVYQPCKSEDIFVFDDRGLFKPNETAYFKGIHRAYVEKNGSLLPVIDKHRKTLSYEIKDPRNNSLKRGTLELTKYGAFSLSYELPDNLNLGDCQLIITGSGTFYHTFKVQEFRTPEYKVTASVASKKYVGSSSAIIKTKATYYSGGGLSNASATYKVKQSTTSFTPPGLSEYTFLKSTPTWLGYLFGFADTSKSSPDLDPLKWEEKTDSDGTSLLAIGFNENEREFKYPVNVSAIIDVQDINRQVISSSTSFMVHPASLYVGIKSQKQLLQPNDLFKFKVCVSNLDGTLQDAIPIHLKLKRTISVNKGFTTVPVTTIIKETIVKSKKDGVDLAWKIKESGYYSLEASIIDSSDRANQTLINFFVLGYEEPQGSNIKTQQLVLIPNQKIYSTGDKAKILVQAPFGGVSHGHWQVNQLSLIDKGEFVTNKDGYAMIELDITENYLKKATFSVHVTGTEIRKDRSGNLDPKQSRKPAHAFETIFLDISMDSARLDIELVHNEMVSPGSEVDVEILVKDKISGKPIEDVNVTLVAADEAVLSLTGYRIQDFVDRVFVNSALSNRYTSSRNNVYCETPADFEFTEKIDICIPPPCPCPPNMLFSAGFPQVQRSMPAFNSFSRMERCVESAVMMEDKMEMDGMFDDMLLDEKMEEIDEEEEEVEEEKDEEEDKKIAVRSNFSPNAAFYPDLFTNKDGLIKTKIKLPDNLTQFRVSAVAIFEERQFGIKETQLTTQLPISIRPSMPRFLNFGDQAELPVVIVNQSPKPVDVELVASFTNVSLTDESKKALLVSLPIAGRAEIRYPVKTVSAGTARFQMGASVRNSKFTDAVKNSFPVFTPSSYETQATYGEIDGDTAIAQPIKPPTQVFNEFGDMKMELMSTAVNSLTDAFLYLYHYRFACAEQTASRILSIVSLEDIILAFKLAEVSNENDIVNNVKSGLKKLEKLQNTGKYSGAFVWWTTDEEYPALHTTIHATHAMVRCAKSNRHSVPSAMLQRSIKFLQTLKSVFTQSPFSKYHIETQISLRLYALYVIALYIPIDPSLKSYLKVEMEDVISLRGTSLDLDKNDSVWSMDSLAWLAQAMHAVDPKDQRIQQIHDYFMNRVNEDAGTANFITKYDDDGEANLLLLRSNLRTDAVILEFLCRVRPQNELIPKIVKGILASRKKGRWCSTQENVFCLLACQTYFNVFENLTPDFKAQIWLADSYIGDATFKGRTIEKQVFSVPMRFIVPDPLVDEYQSQPLVLSKYGDGRLYYRLSINYAPRDLNLKALNHGFEVIRTYEEIEPNTLYVDDNGVTHVQAGELYRVRLCITNTNRRYHVAVVDYLPAGFEALNPELGSNSLQLSSKDQKTPTISSYGLSFRDSLWYFYWYRPNWYIHENLRDERVEVFSDLLWEGSHEYTFVCRATTIGTFVAPPATAEEMYAEEVFGRSSTNHVIVCETLPNKS